MHRRQRYLRSSFIIGGILVTGICFPQELARKPAIAELSTQLLSKQWIERARGYEKLRSAPTALSSKEVQKNLLDLLDRENQLIESLNRNSGGPPVEENYGEEYSEYIGELGETVDSFADWNDPRQVCIFVHEAYNPESRFAAKIAAHGKVAVPCLIQMYGSDVGLIRAEAAPLIVQALTKTSATSLDQNTILTAKQVVSKALHDPNEAVRINTVEALGNFGGEDMIPALKQVAETDPAPEVNGYSIRKWAVEAIAAIAEILVDDETGWAALRSVQPVGGRHSRHRFAWTTCDWLDLDIERYVINKPFDCDTPILNGGVILDHAAPRERRFVALEKFRPISACPNCLAQGRQDQAVGIKR